MADVETPRTWNAIAPKEPDMVTADVDSFLADPSVESGPKRRVRHYIQQRNASDEEYSRARAQVLLEILMMDGKIIQVDHASVDRYIIVVKP
jgi:hypothetical protein